MTPWRDRSRKTDANKLNIVVQRWEKKQKYEKS